jgi:hypothetical protein
LEPTPQAAGQRPTYASRAQSGRFFILNYVGKTLKHLYHAKWGKVVLVLFVASMVATASATVSVFFYTAGTANVQTPDVQLVAGSDLSASPCSVYPCASGTVTGTHDVLTAVLSFFPAATGASPIPATYYSNFTEIKNTAASGSHSIMSIQILNIAGTTADLGSITIYYCTTQTGFTAAGALATPSNCVGSFSITSGTGGSVTGSFPVSIAGGARQFIEISAYAASGASASTSVTFQIAVQWS